MSQKVVFFDIDGTLLLTGGAGQLAMERALEQEFAIDFPFEGVLTAGRTDRGITNEILDRYGFENNQETRDRFRRAYLKQLPQTLNDAEGLLLPRVVELLDALTKHTHLKLSLLTGNYSEGAWIKLRHYQLDHYFEFGGFGDHNANRNDVAKAALNIAQQAMGNGLVGSDTLVIGDTPADITCARAIGASAMAVATGVYDTEQLKEHDPDYLCDDFSDTATVVDRILELL